MAGIFSIITGAGVLVTDEPLMHLCRRGCWINSLLYGVFGEFYGKAIYGGAGLLIGLVLLISCLYIIVKNNQTKAR